MPERRAVIVRGIVQGVGFRPFVHEAARDRELTGFVRNESRGVAIEVEGEPAAVDSFLRALSEEPPALARVREMEVSRRAPRGDAGFRIEESRSSDLRIAYLPPDTATCPDCIRELRDPSDRRYRYPFLNCTRCGPRFTIVEDLPYDRPRTTMAAFDMCRACRSEYEDPTDRRFHAQPTACPACGPELRLEEPGPRPGGETGGRGEPWEGADGDPLRTAARALVEGAVVAVKGLGGYHLACDASDGGAVRRLRERKHRETKPLALMVPDLDAARGLCRLDAREEEVLTSPRRPIVLLRRRHPAAAGGASVAPEVAPGCADLGVMLPYTPLHELLLGEIDGPLVMTSGNRTDEPIAYRDEDARERLVGIADLLLTHDRPIRARCDDSVVRVMCGSETPIRRSRGYVPEPVPLPDGFDGSPPVLAVGGHLKNTFCLTRGPEAFPGPHVGDLEDLAAYEALREGVSHFGRLFDVRPEVVAHDLHPDYLSTRFARELAHEIGTRTEGVQHHHAHVAACAAEHGATGPVIGVAFDGTGHGTDGAVWGGEVLVADLREFRRVAHLGYVPLPGGEAAVRQPWRMALAHVAVAGREGGERLLETGVARRLARGVGQERWRLVEEMVRGEVESPPTSSVGRLFDAVAALAGVRSEVDFQAQAAMELEARSVAAAGARATGVSGAGGSRASAARLGGGGTYPTGVSRGADGRLRWDAAPMIHAVVADLERGVQPGRVAARFHRAVASSVVELCRAVREEEGLVRVALTGGVFQNALLTGWTVPALEDEGFDVLLHREVPPNDGGLSYGQAAVALARTGSPDRRTERESPVRREGTESGERRTVSGGAPCA